MNWFIENMYPAENRSSDIFLFGFFLMVGSAVVVTLYCTLFL